jgi:hypothetical protein
MRVRRKSESAHKGKGRSRGVYVPGQLTYTGRLSSVASSRCSKILPTRTAGSTSRTASTRQSPDRTMDTAVILEEETRRSTPSQGPHGVWTVTES